MAAGRLIGNGTPWAICAGYLFAGGLMVSAAVVAAWLGVDAAEYRSKMSRHLYLR